MPDGKPTKAPLIIFGTMVTMSIISVGIVFYTHSRRTEPYLDSKMRRVKYVKRPTAVAPAVAPPVAPAIVTAPPDAASPDAGPAAAPLDAGPAARLDTSAP